MSVRRSATRPDARAVRDIRGRQDVSYWRWRCPPVPQEGCIKDMISAPRVTGEHRRSEQGCEHHYRAPRCRGLVVLRRVVRMFHVKRPRSHETCALLRATSQQHTPCGGRRERAHPSVVCGTRWSAHKDGMMFHVKHVDHPCVSSGGRDRVGRSASVRKGRV